MMNYDRQYDTDNITLDERSVATYANNTYCNDMREPRFELGCPKAPDPKSCCPPLNTSDADEATATARHQVARDNTTTTTSGTTSAGVASPRSPSGRWASDCRAPLLPSPCANSEGENAQ